jgi:hypothetical protein
MKIQREDTAIVFIDPQNEVLSEKGLAWPLVRESLQENNTIENMERIFKAAKAQSRRRKATCKDKNVPAHVIPETGRSACGRSNMKGRFFNRARARFGCD